MNSEINHSDRDADYLSGDPGAFAALVVKFQGGLFGFLGRMGFSQAESEELAQETFLRAWKNRGSFDSSKAQISTWIFTIAKNLALNELAKSPPKIADEFDINTLHSTHAGADPDSQYESHQSVKRLQRGLQQLSSDDRLVIAAIFTPDMNDKAVANVLNCSEGAVRTRLSRARQRLNEALQELDKYDE